MLGADVFVAQAVGLVVSLVDDPLDAGRDEHLACPAAIDRGLGRGPQDFVQPGADHLNIDVDPLQHLRDHAIRLLDQRQQEVFDIDLVMAVAHQDFVGAGRRILQTFGETVKAHHRWLIHLHGGGYCCRLPATPLIHLTLS